ncbi:MAG: toll/interleukin-1 receptor domain-containing protein [bacterium]|nr:toll/interleukin-1 receptor domain-containing protein [bacterium]
MPKSLVFISHITAESEIAVEFKALIEQHFLGLIDVFVSSDGASITMGQKWLQDISQALEQCAVEIVICSPESVTRPWINFEAGAGWVRGIPVIPLCHSGIEPSSLPIPLNLLQAAKATDVSALSLVFPVLATALGANAPSVDFTDFIEKVRDFEHRYTFWKQCNDAFETLQRVNDRILVALKAGNNVNIDLSESEINFLVPHFEFLRAQSILDLKRIGNTKATTAGIKYDCTILLLPQFSKTVADPNFRC